MHAGFGAAIRLDSASQHHGVALCCYTLLTVTSTGSTPLKISYHVCISPASSNRLLLSLC
jgi:hypothetical protein